MLVIELGAGAAPDPVIERLRPGLRAPVTPARRHRHPLGLSIGAVRAHPGERVDALVDRADQAMYQAKRDRSGPVIVTP